MVCLAASIVTKNGKVLVSRQYVDMNRIRVEGLLAAFPKLVGTGKQHTYVETENVRYVYQPMEGLYLLLITNKQSNILEDLETLRLLSKVVREYVADISEPYVSEHAFDLLFAFDEVISLGHKEEVTVAQVRQNTEMDSNEEKLINMIKGEKIKQVNDHMNVRAREIERERVDRSQRGGGDPFRTSTALSSRPEASTSSMTIDDGPSFAPTPTPSGLDRAGARAMPGRSGPSKGMKLGKDKKTDLLSAMEGELGGGTGAAKSTGGGYAEPAAPAAPADPVSVSIEEKLSVKMNKEGGLQHMEVQGTLVLLCTTEEAAYVQVGLRTGTNAGFQFKTHPNIDKALYSGQQKLGVRDPARPFPINVPQGVLKWRYQTADEAQVPITINCWPTPSGSETYLNIEYESAATYDLQRVVISVPGVYSAPKVNSCDGDWRVDKSSSCLLWTIDLVDDSNRSGSMEVVVESASPDSFFPCTVSFVAKATLCDIEVPQCISTQTQAPVRFGLSKELAVSAFEVLH